MKKAIMSLIAVLLCMVTQLSAAIQLADKSEKNTFPLATAYSKAAILVHNSQPMVVQLAKEMLNEDINRVTSSIKAVDYKNCIIAGTPDSPLIKKLVENGQLDISGIEGKWETYLITIIDNPNQKSEKALVIAGSDRRAVAYGLLEISSAIGVSPWYWWADVPAETKDELYLKVEKETYGPPSVKYRGIFLNDEDWGLQPWAALKMDTDIKDVGPKTYARIFELLLRMKANCIWPAMHPSTQAFNNYPENKVVADNYAIVMGASHCEPMLRNNVTEWDHDNGDWNYKTNRDRIYKYWEDRVKINGKYDNLYTIGMRGIHDSGIPGGGTQQEKMERVAQVIRDQREMLANHVNPDPSQVPQIFCPYKEVLQIYQLGLDVPDDVTIVWPDDNHGYIRNLDNPTERKRSGGSGIYYHLSYWGVPHDYLWLCSTPPALIAYEMQKAYAYGADKLWMFNVGDIKPAEMEMQFALAMAWDVNKWTVDSGYDFIRQWSEDTFGAEYAGAITAIKKEYYNLGQNGKPEHLADITFSLEQQNDRLSRYAKITAASEDIYNKIDKRFQDAFFQLVLYPVRCSYLMNQKFFLNEQGQYDKALAAFEEIKAMTNFYNHEIADGKWEGMMDYRPRRLNVFKMPAKIEGDGYIFPDNPAITISAKEYSSKSATPETSWKELPGLGVGDYGLALMPYTLTPISEEHVTKAPELTYSFDSSAGECGVNSLFVPTHRINQGMTLKYAISVDGDDYQVININSESMSNTWRGNVLQGYSKGTTSHKLSGAGKHTIKLKILDPGMVFTEFRIFEK